MTSNQLNAPIRILLADDDKDDRFFFEKALSADSISSELVTVHDGEHLMKYLAENVKRLPDVLFLDLNMPRKNGFECLTEIKESKPFKKIPVVMFSTSYPRDKNYELNMITMLYKIGAIDFIRKPDNFFILKKVIHDSLTKVMDNKPLIKAA
jgi:CheY-like chemotaxis protein